MLNVKQSGRRKAYMLSAALLATTVLGGGSFVLSSAFADSTPATAPLSAPVVGPQAGFADLVSKVKSAVVNIATDQKRAASSDQDGHGMPQIPGMPQMPGQDD